MRNLAVLALVLAALHLTGCMNFSPYHPFNATSGYSDAPLKQGVTEVQFVGTPEMNSTQAKYFATLRAAELTRNAGREHFELLTVEDRSGSREEVVSGKTTVTTTEQGAAKETTNKNDKTQASDRKEVTTVEEKPSHVVTRQFPVCVLTFRPVPAATANSLSASPLIMDAINQKYLVLRAD